MLLLKLLGIILIVTIIVCAVLLIHGADKLEKQILAEREESGEREA